MTESTTPYRDKNGQEIKLKQMLTKDSFWEEDEDKNLDAYIDFVNGKWMIYKYESAEFVEINEYILNIYQVK